VLVPFSELLVCERAPDFTPVECEGFYYWCDYFDPESDWDVNFDISLNSIKSSPCLVSQVVHSFIKIHCVVNIYAKIIVVLCVLKEHVV